LSGDALDKSLMLGHLQASLHDPRSIAIFSVWNLQKPYSLFKRTVRMFMLVLFGFSKDRSAVDVTGNESQSGDKDAFSAFSTAKTRIIY
jgi:hypothetical protein